LMAHRAELECGRIVITHMSENMLDHLTEVELEAAADGTVIEVGNLDGARGADQYPGNDA
jgi:hypothetical protein